MTFSTIGETEFNVEGGGGKSENFGPEPEQLTVTAINDPFVLGQPFLIDDCRCCG